MPQDHPRIPKCMSTQHPDNVNPPFFSESSELGGEDEIQEAFYVFSHLNCDEQMWDCEGKEVDSFVVKKLLSRYEGFFRDHQIGKDLFITLRVPNPTVERDEAKILLETLESIPRSFDTAKLFYKNDIPPIFEVILPMTSSPKCVDRIYKYYRDFVAGKQDNSFREGDITIAEWIGSFEPREINVIPLFEDMKNMLAAHEITREYLKDKDVDHQRVFLARSDPALNYGLVSAILMNKIALWNLGELEREIGVELLPIIGVGSAPFRGNFRPKMVEGVMDEYPSVHTFTIQSSFKFDNPPNDVWRAAEKIYQRSRRRANDVDQEKYLAIIDKYSHEYKNQVLTLAPLINDMARFVPSRRKRKLHIGLFGYSRSVEGIALPRAIGFTAALYSIGLPPEILGLNALSQDEIQYVMEECVHFRDDLTDSVQYLNPQSLSLLPESVGRTIEEIGLDYQPNEEHNQISSYLVENLRMREPKRIEEALLRAANLRGFLG